MEFAKRREAFRAYRDRVSSRGDPFDLKRTATVRCCRRILAVRWSSSDRGLRNDGASLIGDLATQSRCLRLSEYPTSQKQKQNFQ